MDARGGREPKYRWGADISGYVRADGFEPSAAALCPDCCHRPYWADEAEYGEPLDEDGLESLIDQGSFCEACGRPAAEWRIE
jgi:hypothetical protein